MEKKTDLSKYIVNVQGKDFITFPGLLAEAHNQGLSEITTEIVTPLDLNNPIVKATVKLSKIEGNQIRNSSYTGYGDANSNNVAKKVAGALIRMAETRAIARALRFACNIDMTALEEIGVADDEVETAPRTSFKKPTAVVQNTPGPVDVPPVGAGSSGVLTVPAGTDLTKTTSLTPEPTVVQNSAPKRTFSKRTTQKTEPNFP